MPQHPSTINQRIRDLAAATSEWTPTDLAELDQLYRELADSEQAESQLLLTY